MKEKSLNKTENILFNEIKNLVEKSRINVVTNINSELVSLYWNIGNIIRSDILKNKRADYGKQIVNKLSEKLTSDYGKGFGARSLRRYIRFSEIFPDFQIVSALRTKFSWTQFRSLMGIDDEIKRSFYMEMCKLESWSTRTLDKKIDSMLFERTAISKKPHELKNENTPIGLILCSEAAGEHIELLLLDQKNIKVAQYLTELPPKEVLKKQLHKAILSAKEKLAARENEE